MLKKQNKNNNVLNVQMVWTKQEINKQKTTTYLQII